MNESKAMILGCGGLELTDDERAFFRAERPWGFILFARNISEANQIRDLVADLRACLGRPDAPVLIDQEGGRVQRIKPPLVARYPAARVIGTIHDENRKNGLRAAWLQGRLHAHDLMQFGINVDCLPVLDVPSLDGHDAIGNRAYSLDPATVSSLGAEAAAGLTAGGVLPVIKHMPGHGRATVDSHLALPLVDEPIAALREKDFVPFRALNTAPMAMTAHIVFSHIDPHAPATSSKQVIEQIIRGEIGFDGLLMSDDVSMKALSGDFPTKTRAIFAAGCDVILHCNGDLPEMNAISAHTPVLNGAAAERARMVMSRFAPADLIEEQALREEFTELTEQFVPTG